MNLFENIKLVLVSLTIVLSVLTISRAGEKNSTISKNNLEFTSRVIADSARHWWAHTPAEITGDGIVDLVFINNNSSGGFLGYYEGKTSSGLWDLTIIAENPPTGGVFASGDLEAGDIDGDCDTDVLAVKHPGEWADADAAAEIFWYENTEDGWKPHAIGQVPDAVKDLSLTDFDNDGNIDLSVLTFEDHTLSIFRQEDADNWIRIQFITDNEALHEGMATGDLDGDGDVDIFANGFIYENPGSNLSEPWSVSNIDTIWNNQEGDWSRNGTKTYVSDINSDGTSEIFICHSERAGYPLNLYQMNGGKWSVTTIADEIPACHTLQVYDFDLDGNADVLAGVNRARALNLDIEESNISIFLSGDNFQSWTEKVIGTEGIYNGQAADYDGDGDFDIFRYPNHEATEFYLLENIVLDKD